MPHQAQEGGQELVRVPVPPGGGQARFGEGPEEHRGDGPVGSTLRERRLDRLVALEVATAAVATGWALQGAPLGVVLNVGFVAAFAAAWWWPRPAARV
jgi:hypothetical protein